MAAAFQRTIEAVRIAFSVRLSIAPIMRPSKVGISPVQDCNRVALGLGPDVTVALDETAKLWRNTMGGLALSHAAVVRGETDVARILHPGERPSSPGLSGGPGALSRLARAGALRSRARNSAARSSARRSSAPVMPLILGAVEERGDFSRNAYPHLGFPLPRRSSYRCRLRVSPFRGE